ncbi:MAG: TetR/AcrR family transcriptional regulator [Erysipelotrichaceae bacterium]
MRKASISKEKILEVAKELVDEIGFANFNMRLLAKKSEVALGSIYNYYPTKSDLVIAVIEDFWDKAFVKEDYHAIKDKGFYEGYYILYRKLNEYLKKFKSNWVAELSYLDRDIKKQARDHESDYFEKIQMAFMHMLEKDPNITNYPWSNECERKLFASFILNETIVMLKNGNEDPTFFIKILKIILA